MARNESENTPVLKCPHCGNDDPEEMCAKQLVSGAFYIMVNKGVIHLDALSFDMDLGDASDGLLSCGLCHKDFVAPSEFVTKWA